MTTDFGSLCIRTDSSIRQAIDCIERSTAKIVLVVDAERRLLDTITDGDIRRAILADTNLDADVSDLRGRKGSNSRYQQAITASIETEKSVLLILMKQNDS